MEYMSVEEAAQKWGISIRSVQLHWQKGNVVGAHILGDVGEISPKELDEDSDHYYKSGDFIGKLGVERSYEKQLRGEKGMRIMLRDVRGR